MEYYNIAELVISIDTGSVKLQKELDEFRMTDTPETADIHFRIDETGNDLRDTYQFKKKERWIVAASLLHVLEREDRYVVIYKYPKLVYGYEVFKNSTDTIIYLNPMDVEVCDTYDIVLEKHGAEDATGPELFLYSLRDAFFFHAQKFGKIAVHSSSIIYKDKVYLFSAASGGGKTTHVEQWAKAGLSHIPFNGDVTLCYEKDGKIMAGGLPWCGTSNLYLNQNIEIGGIVFLQQGQENKVISLTNAERALQLGARCLTPNWNRTLMANNMDIVEAIVPKILMGSLTCDISTEAAKVARDFVEGRL